MKISNKIMPLVGLAVGLIALSGCSDEPDSVPNLECHRESRVSPDCLCEAETMTRICSCIKDFPYIMSAI